MNKNHKSLELDKILEMLAEQTSFEDARNLALSTEPSPYIFEVNELINETSDAHSLIARFGAPAFGNLHNINNSLRRAEAGAVLNSLELLRAAYMLQTIRSVSEWRDRSASVQTALDMRFNALVPNKYLETKITSAKLQTMPPPNSLPYAKKLLPPLPKSVNIWIKSSILPPCRNTCRKLSLP